MAVSQADIQARIRQIQKAGGGDTAATRAQIAKEAQQYGVTPEQLSRATGVSSANIRNMAKEAGQAFAPMNLAGGGMLGGTTVGAPTTSITTSTGVTPGTMFEIPAPKFEAYTPTITSGMLTDIAKGDTSKLSDFLYSAATSGKDTRAMRPLIEELTTQATGNKGTDPAYNTLVGASAEAKLKADYNDAVARGDFTKAQELQDVLQKGTDASFRYFEDQYGEGSAHTLVQQTFNDPFGIGEPGKYQTSFFEKIGDAVSDVVQNPFVQAAAAFIPGVGPAVSSVLQAWGTLDSGENLSPAQIVAALSGVSELSSLEGGNLIAKLPPQIRETATAFQKALEGGWDEAYAALKDAGLDATSEQFAAFEDAFRTAVGDENIEAFSEGFASFDDGLRELFGGDFSGFGDFLTQDDLTAALAGIQTGGGFTAPRGSQAGLGRPRLTKYEGSSVMDIMNQPSSIQKIG